MRLLSQCQGHHIDKPSFFMHAYTCPSSDTLGTCARQGAVQSSVVLHQATKEGGVRGGSTYPVEAWHCLASYDPSLLQLTNLHPIMPLQPASALALATWHGVCLDGRVLPQDPSAWQYSITAGQKGEVQVEQVVPTGLPLHPVVGLGASVGFGGRVVLQDPSAWHHSITAGHMHGVNAGQLHVEQTSPTCLPPQGGFSSGSAGHLNSGCGERSMSMFQTCTSTCDNIRAA